MTQKTIAQNVTLQIKKEQLVIAKKWIQTGEVKIYKETFVEEKKFIIPIEHENLVIEKILLDSTTGKHKDVNSEIIRIPISEEQIEFTKHKVNLEDVSIYKQEIEDIKHIEETLKTEIPKVKIYGSPKVTNK